MKKTTKKVLALASSAVLLVSASVMGTMAYLTHTTETVTNTFSVGKVTFGGENEAGLDEADVDLYGKVESTTRVQENQYKLIPGHEYTKDPTVHIGDDSEDCWLFVKVENDIAAIENDTEELDENNGTIAEQMELLGWTAVAGADNVYAYKEVVKAGADVVVFNAFRIADNADVSAYADEEGNVTADITIIAYAVQADGFETAAAAWAAAPSNWQ